MANWRERAVAGDEKVVKDLSQILILDEWPVLYNSKGITALVIIYMKGVGQCTACGAVYGGSDKTAK